MIFSTNLASATTMADVASSMTSYFHRLATHFHHNNTEIPQAPRQFDSHKQSADSDEDVPEGIGRVAHNLMGPVEVTAGFISSSSIVIGMSCLFAAFVRYMQYRVNPLAHPISTVVILLIAGIVLLCLPFVYKLTESGVPFSLG